MIILRNIGYMIQKQKNVMLYSNTKNLRNEFKYANNIEKKIKKNYKKL
jgi:hypothetical protein